MPPRRRHYEGFVICDHKIPQRGKMMTWSAPFYQARIIEDAEFVPSRPNTLQASWEELTTKSVMLEWKQGLILRRGIVSGLDHQIDFWLPAGEDTAWAIDKLMSSYTEQARKARRGED